MRHSRNLTLSETTPDANPNAKIPAGSQLVSPLANTGVTRSGDPREALRWCGPLFGGVAP